MSELIGLIIAIVLVIVFILIDDFNAKRIIDSKHEVLAGKMTDGDNKSTNIMIVKAETARDRPFPRKSLVLDTRKNQLGSIVSSHVLEDDKVLIFINKKIPMMSHIVVRRVM